MATRHDKKSDNEAQAERTSPQEALSAAAKHAHRAMDSAKGLVAGADVNELSAKVTDAASALYRGGLDLVANSEELSQAKAQLSDAIRKNPLAAVGIAFTAGLVLALLTRG
jgi:ElaB/YqjD/DUF883 family membrane-anchored ribosome-binding protein